MTKGTHHTKSDAVSAALRRMIVEGEIAAGAPIEETVMMERLDVGRTPLREALQRLAEEDLVRRLPNRGYFVSDISATDLFHIFEIRENMEILAARLAADRARAEHIAEFEALLVDARAGVAAGNQDRNWNLGIDERFHDLLARASGNAYLHSMIMRYYSLSVRVLYLSHLQMALIRDELATYEAMLAALIAHDVTGAGEIMQRHMTFDPSTLVPSFPRRT
jgi:DNA-binding GntR family transcriptional regulator